MKYLKNSFASKFLLAHFQSKYPTLPQDTRTIWNTFYNYLFNLYFIYNGILLSYKKEWNSAICSNMDKPREDHTQFSSVQSLSRVQLFATPWIAACQASLSITNSWSSLRLTSIESVMPSSHLILCCPLLLLPPSQHQSLFQWVNSSHEVAKVLEFQL